MFILKVDALGITSMQDGSRSFKDVHADVFGFAIGADSLHDLVLLETPQGKFQLSAGVVLPLMLPKLQAQASFVSALRFPQTVAGVLAGAAFGTPDPDKLRRGIDYAEVCALTSPLELSLPAKRNPLYGRFTMPTNGAGSFATILTLPWAGRRHGFFHMKNLDGSNAISYKLTGQSDASTGLPIDAYEFVASTALAAGAGVAFHIGGTDNTERGYDNIIVQVNTSNKVTVHYELED